LPEPIFRFAQGEWPAQLGLFVLKLRLEVNSEFGEDVILPLPGQMLFYGLQITIK
jgi:hypothetical protein